MPEQCILTVDTGGSKTRAALYAPDGRLIGDLNIDTGFGYAIDEADVIIVNLSEALYNFCKVNAAEPCAVCVNLGGKNDRQIYNTLHAMFPTAKTEVIRESSGILMDALRATENADAILLAGTGAIALAAGKTGYFVSDGWGAEIGDDGSGYWIGREAVRQSLVQLEGKQPLSPLAQEITGCKEPFVSGTSPDCLMHARDAVRSRLRPTDRAGIARFTKLCAAAAKDGDKCAASVLDTAGTLLARTCVRALESAGAPEASGIVVIGGLTNCIMYWQNGFKRELARLWPNAVWRVSNTDLTTGAFQYYLNHMKGA